MAAIRYNADIEIIQSLLEKGLDINHKSRRQWTPLMLAVSHRNSDIVKLLLDNGANINDKKSDGFTALMIGMHPERFSLEKFNLLIKYGADVNIKTNTESTPLMYAAHFGRNIHLDVFKILLNLGVNINSTDDEGNTALMIAAYFIDSTSSIDTIKFLLENGANIFEVNNGRKDAIDLCKSKECKQFLSKYGWNKLYERDLDIASKYSRQSIFPKDVWTLILLNRRQQLLCQNLSTDKNKEVLKFFAIELNIPINEQMTKAQLCGLISKQIVYGKIYHKTNDEMNRIKRDMIRIAKSFGIDTNRSIKEIAKDLGKVLI